MILDISKQTMYFIETESKDYPYWMTSDGISWLNLMGMSWEDIEAPVELINEFNALVSAGDTNSE